MQIKVESLGESLIAARAAGSYLAEAARRTGHLYGCDCPICHPAKLLEQACNELAKTVNS